MYHIDRVLRETKEVVDNGFYEIYINTEIDDNSDIAELMRIYKSSKIPDNTKFPRTCKSIRNLKIGKGRDEMCEIVEEYAKKKVEVAEKEHAKKTAVKLLKIGKLTPEEIADSVSVLSVEEIIDLQNSVLQVS